MQKGRCAMSSALESVHEESDKSEKHNQRQGVYQAVDKGD